MRNRIKAVTITAVAAVLAATAAAFAASPQKLTPGDQSRWPLDFRVRLEQPSSHGVEIHARGEWRSTIVGVRRGEYDVQLQIADLQFTGDPVKNVSPAAVAELRSRLTRPFWITYRSDGRMTATHPNGLGPDGPVYQDGNGVYSTGFVNTLTVYGTVFNATTMNSTFTIEQCSTGYTTSCSAPTALGTLPVTNGSTASPYTAFPWAFGDGTFRITITTTTSSGTYTNSILLSVVSIG